MQSPLSTPSQAQQPQQRLRNVEIHVHDDKTSIIYDHTPGRKDIPTVLYLPGFFYARSKTAKPAALALQCRRKQQGFLVFDYSGTGRSGGDFAHGTVSRWVAECEAVLDAALDRSREKVVLVGSGIGGWIMLHVAMRRRDQVVGLVGLSADPDFTEKLLRPALTEAQTEELDKVGGMVELEWGYRKYPIHHALVEDGKKMLVLNGVGSIDVDCPMRLVAGMADEEVPTSLALELVDAVKTRDVCLEFVKHGDHALELEEDFRRMWRAVCEVADKYYEFDLGSPASG